MKRMSTVARDVAHGCEIHHAVVYSGKPYSEMCSWLSTTRSPPLCLDGHDLNVEASIVALVLLIALNLLLDPCHTIHVVCRQGQPSGP